MLRVSGSLSGVSTPARGRSPAAGSSRPRLRGRCVSLSHRLTSTGTPCLPRARLGAAFAILPGHRGLRAWRAEQRPTGVAAGGVSISANAGSPSAMEPHSADTTIIEESTYIERPALARIVLRIEGVMALGSLVGRTSSGSPGAGRKERPLGGHGSMIGRPIARLVLAALLVTLHVGGFRAAAPATRAAVVTAGSCCCLGECHCTGDCCNHAPDADRDTPRSSVRPADGLPRWESPRTCGGWQVTLTRSPGGPEQVVVACCPWQAPPAPPGPRLRHLFPEARSGDALRAATPPRAPPTA